MVVAFDADVLILLLQPSIDPPIDPTTQRPVEYVSDRLAQLVADLTERDARVIVRPGACRAPGRPGGGRVGAPQGHRQEGRFRIEPFSAADAVEAAASTREALARGDKKSGADASWPCVKTDRQIVAVARRCGVQTIYSNDAGMRKFAGDIPVVSVWELPVPPEPLKLQFGDP